MGHSEPKCAIKRFGGVIGIGKRFFTTNMVRGGDRRREGQDVSGGGPLLERTWIPAFGGMTGSIGNKSPAPAVTVQVRRWDW